MPIEDNVLRNSLREISELVLLHSVPLQTYRLVGFLIKLPEYQLK